LQALHAADAFGHCMEQTPSAGQRSKDALEVDF
jgi:hypothetical protein